MKERLEPQIPVLIFKSESTYPNDRYDRLGFYLRNIKSNPNRMHKDVTKGAYLHKCAEDGSQYMKLRAMLDQLVRWQVCNLNTTNTTSLPSVPSSSHFII
jgi:hypothetical protein